MNNRTSLIAFFVLSGSFATTPLLADVRLPALFGDHMVLQRDTQVPVWGLAAPNEFVTVAAGLVKASATADANGKWNARLAGLKATDQPIDLMVAGKNTITLHDVLVGDVWVCSGQSNMEFPFNEAHNAKMEIPHSDHPTLRMFMVQKKVAFEPQTDCSGSWAVSTPATVAKFSAVGYFFGREILKDQKVPVGMIGSYWGGTMASSWTSFEALKKDPAFFGLSSVFEQRKANLPELKREYELERLPKWQKDHAEWAAGAGKVFAEARTKWVAEVATAKAAGKPSPPKPEPAVKEPRKPVAPDEDINLPTALWNGMISPLVSYGIKGVIWYQGEANCYDPRQYEKLFPALITDWRSRWAQGEFPFIWVQLASYMERNIDPEQTSDGWPGLREAQSKTLKLPNTGQAVIIDIGEGDNIHPRNKVDVGLRLSLAARQVAYGEDLVYTGPIYDSMRVEGSKIRVKFKNVGTGLVIGAPPPFA